MFDTLMIFLKELDFKDYQKHEKLSRSCGSHCVDGHPMICSCSLLQPPRSEDSMKSRELYDKVTTRLESIKLQQYLMESREKQHQQVCTVNLCKTATLKMGAQW